MLTAVWKTIPYAPVRLVWLQLHPFRFLTNLHKMATTEATTEAPAPRAPKDRSKFSTRAPRAEKKRAEEPRSISVEDHAAIQKESLGWQRLAEQNKTKRDEYATMLGQAHASRRQHEENNKEAHIASANAMQRMGNLETKLSAAVLKQKESESEFQSKQEELDECREEFRSATIMAMEERALSEARVQEALAELETMQSLLHEERDRLAAVNVDLSSTRAECELLRSKTVDDRLLAELKRDRGAMKELQLSNAENKRLLEKVSAEKISKDSWMKKADQAQTEARLEKAQRLDEVRLMKEKILQLERTNKRAEEASKTSEKRITDLNQQLTEERSKKRDLEDEKIRLASKLRSSESSIRSLETRLRDAGSNSTLNAASADSSVGELARLDVQHAEKRALDSERREKRVDAELREEQRRKVELEQELSEAKRDARNAIQDLQSSKTDLARVQADSSRKLALLNSRIADLESAAVSASSKSMDLERELSSAKRNRLENANANAPLSPASATLVQNTEMQLAMMDKEHAQRKLADAERREKAAQEDRDMARAKQLQLENEIVALKMQLEGSTFRERVKSPHKYYPDPPSATKLKEEYSESHNEEMSSENRKQYRKEARLGKEAREDGRLEDALIHLTAAYTIKPDEKLAKIIAKVKSQLN